jgi:ubiquinone/menaquinone biosynthesis C-methylase UbiE
MRKFLAHIHVREYSKSEISWSPVPVKLCSGSISHAQSRITSKEKLTRYPCLVFLESNYRNAVLWMVGTPRLGAIRIKLYSASGFLPVIPDGTASNVEKVMSMSIQKAYNDWSETYDMDENLTRDLDQKVTLALLANLHFTSILEIGCGTGKNTSFFALIGESVLAVDFSEGMIERAKQKVQAENVRFFMMDITQKWEVEDQSFDLIVCNLVLEHIKDLSFVFSEARRSLRDNGRFFLNELHPFKQYEGKKARFYRDQEKIEVDAFVHHISDFFNAAQTNGLSLVKLDEYWHEEDENKPPRLITLLFEK